MQIKLDVNGEGTGTVNGICTVVVGDNVSMACEAWAKYPTKTKLLHYSFVPQHNNSTEIWHLTKPNFKIVLI